MSGLDGDEMMHADDVMAAPFLRRVVRVQGSAIVYKYADIRNLVDTGHWTCSSGKIPGTSLHLHFLILTIR